MTYYALKHERIMHDAGGYEEPLSKYMSGAERRSPLLLPFEVPSQGTSP